MCLKRLSLQIRWRGRGQGSSASQCSDLSAVGLAAAVVVEIVAESDENSVAAGGGVT